MKQIEDEAVAHSMGEGYAASAEAQSRVCCFPIIPFMDVYLGPADKPIKEENGRQEG